MGRYPDGMQRLTRFALTLAVAGLLAAPAAAADDGWQPASGVSGTYTVLRTADGLAIAGGYGGAVETGPWGEVVAPGADDWPTWAAAPPPTDAALRDVARAVAQPLFAVGARGMPWRSGGSGPT